MLILLDNFDSFTYNLVQYFQILGEEVKVVRNNALSVEQCLKLKPKHIVIGPGPGSPDQAGITKPLIQACAGHVPILGICLGMQAIAEVFGGNIQKDPQPMHGKTSEIFHQKTGVFKNLTQGFLATRYHSLIVCNDTLPKELEVSARSKDGTIMGLRHTHYPIEGVQFHPESILTKPGLALLKNFINDPVEYITMKGARYV